MPYFKTASLSLCAALLISACGNSDTITDAPNTVEAPIMNAGGDTLGTLTLKDLGDAGTEVSVEVSGISAGAHAMHFHETGRCDGPDFKTAGGHYNPTNAAHGKEMANGPHAGDMMNIDVGSDGRGGMTVVNSRVSITGAYNLPALMDGNGTALILHAGADDYKSQPSGAAGARIGCAVISG